MFTLFSAICMQTFFFFFLRSLWNPRVFIASQEPPQSRWNHASGSIPRSRWYRIYVYPSQPESLQSSQHLQYHNCVVADPAGTIPKRIYLTNYNGHCIFSGSPNGIALCTIKVIALLHRKRINTDEKAKVVAALWGTHLNAALSIWHAERTFLTSFLVGYFVWCAK